MSAIPSADRSGPSRISPRSSPSPTTAEVPAVFAAIIASSRRATFAIAWSRFQKTRICSANYFNTAFPPDEASRATALEICFSPPSPISPAISRKQCTFPRRCSQFAGASFLRPTQNVTLEAELEDGSLVAGETNISRSKQRIRRIRLVPRRVRPLSEVLAALHAADLILVGPGSLYTSIIPNLLVEGVTEAIAHSQRHMCLHRESDDATRRDRALLRRRSCARHLRTHRVRIFRLGGDQSHAGLAANVARAIANRAPSL